ncbi:MAG: DNA-binding NtrC family response regulator [Pirellulaceae bacterium]|jgi:DNA-binding NtrC family response regulator
MLARILLATSSEAIQSRFRQLSDRPDTIVEVAKGDASLWETVSRENFDLVVVSRSLIGASASETVSSLRTLPESPDIVVLCEQEDPEERASLLAAGCLSVLYTGLPNDMLQEALYAAVERRLQTAEEALVPTDAPLQPQLSDFVSASPAMETFMDVVHRVVASGTTLLIMGETGVGKERLARAIHAESPRSAGPFISVNCGALSETLLESELFGHEEGAFTGASRARRGWFELAHGGTIFLDEIGEMPRHLQVKLLTVLQTREVRRVGAESSVLIDVRVMAATNRDLAAEVEAGDFRRDLYYRLSVVSLTIPPLCERREDIPALARGLLDHFRGEIPYHIEGIAPQAMEALCRYDWPGNVRELMNVIERAMLLTSDGEISGRDLPATISGLVSDLEPEFPTPQAIEEERLSVPQEWLKQPLRDARQKLLSEFERAYLVGLLEETGGKIGETAKRAGIQPRSLFEKMKRLGLQKEDYRRGPK